MPIVRPRHVRVPLAALMVVLLIAALPSGGGGAVRSWGTRTLSDFPAIHSPVLSDYDHYQLKFTVLGAQLQVIPSCGVVSAPRAGGFVLPEFVDFERTPGYGNDGAAMDTLTIPSVEFKAYVDALAMRPALHDTTQAAEPEVSLMILRNYGPTAVCWEHQTTTQAETDTLLQVLINCVVDPLTHARLHEIRHHLAGVRR
jgi:hypothetical protein